MTQTNKELVEAAKEAQRLLAQFARPTGSVSGVAILTTWSQCVEVELRLRTALQSNPDNIQEGGK